MKKLLIPFVFYLFSCNENYIKEYCRDNHPEVVHNSADKFALDVGDVLKERYEKGHPVRVKDIRTTLSYSDVDAYGEGFEITWEAFLEDTDSLHADYYFDRRGTLLSGKNEEDAVEAVEQEIKTSKKVQIMMDKFDSAYGNHFMPISFVKQSITYCKDRKEWWCLEEYFCTAKKK